MTNNIKELLIDKPIVNQNCISCGLCEVYCPEVFTLETWQSTVKVIEDYSKYKKQIKMSIEDCPVNAISYEEDLKK